MKRSEPSMKGILINPHDKSVTQVEVGGLGMAQVDAIHKLIDCETFDVVNLGNGETLFVDDNGLLVDNPGPFFVYRGYHQPLAGKGLILGVDASGESVDTKLSVEQVMHSTTFPDIEFLGHDEIPEGTKIDHPILGKDTPVIGFRPRFRKK